MDVEFKIYVSTSGDFVSLGTKTDYPFTAGGSNGVPTGWTPFIAAGGLQSEISFSTGNGRFNISNAAASNFDGRQYGVKRTFALNSGSKYIVAVRAQTMQGKAAAGRYPQIWISGSPYWSMADLTQPLWERVIGWTYYLSGISSLDVYLTAYNVAGQVDKNWGMQWDSFSITEQLPTYPLPTWQEVTCDARSVLSRYGRERFTARYEVGGFQLSLINNDGQFTYDPSGTLRPGRFIKATVIRPNESPAETPLFYGVVDSLTDAYSLDGQALTAISCFDISSLLSNTNVPTCTGTLNTSGNRIGTLYSAVQWHESQQRTDAGLYTQQKIYANGRSIRDEIGLCADSEAGYWFADRSGVLQYYDRDWPKRAATQTAVQANIFAMPDPAGLPIVDQYPDVAGAPWVCAHTLNTNWSKDRVVNEVSLANAGGVAKTYIDDPSQNKFGPSTYQRYDFVNDNAHPEYLDQRATDIMTGFTDAILRVNSVEFRPQPDNIIWATNVFLNDLVRVWYVHPANLWAYAIVTHVQSVEHRVTVDDWTVLLALDQPVAFTRFAWDPNMGIHGWDYALWDGNYWDQGSAVAGAAWSSGYKWSNAASKWGK